MKLRWTPEALRDRAAIWDYIAEDDPNAAERIDRLLSTAARLADFPMLGQPGMITGTRELVPHKSYRLVYEIVGDTVWILTLVHAARQWPPA